MACMNDNLGRNIDYLRVSLTDRCNMRCRYCMPEEGTTLYSHQEMLTLEEVARVCGCAARLGISRIRLTGGEPLVRRNVVWLTKQLTALPGITEVSMTTNGALLPEYAAGLKEAGLSGVNVSLDTLNRERFLHITRRDLYDQVLAGIGAAKTAGLKVKLNCAVSEDFDRKEVLDFAQFSIVRQIPVRFIEMMPIGQGRTQRTVDNDTLLEVLKKEYPDTETLQKSLGGGPAVYYTFAGGKGCIGLISAVHHKFCGQCNRVRLTSDGYLKLCLAREDGIGLRDRLRGGISEEELMEIMAEAIRHKPEGHSFGLDGDRRTNINMNRIGG